MQLVTFRGETGARLGVVRGESIVDVALLAEQTGIPLPATMLELIDAGPAALEHLAYTIAAAGHGVALVPLVRAMLLAPIPRPRKNVVCLGLNYLAHAEESAAARGRPFKRPEHPVFFTKAPTAVNSPYGVIPYDPAISTEIDWEVELAFVIGRQGKNIPAAQAMGYVFGYTVLNDISARDLQSRHGGQFFKGKSLDGSCPIGPVLMTADEIGQPHALSLSLWVNGSLKQHGSTADMLFSIPAIIEILSRGQTLEPGDIIATGTPPGVGMARTPPEYLQPGDVVIAEIEGIGRLENIISLG